MARGARIDEKGESLTGVAMTVFVADRAEPHDPDKPIFDAGRLRQHEALVHRDLEWLRLPANSWVPAAHTPDGELLLDVVVIGAGMYGIAAATALIFKGIGNIAILDRNERGREGPWTTYARMPTLRSPKQLPGPALGVPSLTFRAWYEASFGDAAFGRLYKVFNQDWQDYLNWLQRVLKLPVTNNCEVARLSLQPNWIELVLADGAVMKTRRVVVATGRSGAGGSHIPSFVDRKLFPDLAAHSSEAIDFEALAGHDIGIIGASASAWDNAATALEAGAATATIFSRRDYLPQINKGRAASQAGFLEGWTSLTPAQKWLWVAYVDDSSTPPPHETVHRTMRHAGLVLRFNSNIALVERACDKVRMIISGEEKLFDFLIVGTGFNVDIAEDPLFSEIAAQFASWGDRYAPPEQLQRRHLAAMPFLDDGFELQEKVAGSVPSIGRIHVFNPAAALSLGQTSSDVPGLTIGAERLARRISHHFFNENFDEIMLAVQSCDDHELAGTPLHVQVDPVTNMRIA
jgi:cation diffusion facilitator CzcD-associated flavoprotein CzcO